MDSRETNTSDSSPREETKKETPWKLILVCIVFVLVFFLFIFYPPAKQILYETQNYLQSQGWYGSLGLCLITSFIIVPFGIPYSMVQMMFAIMIPQFWLALLLTSISQTLGSVITYMVMKYAFKEKLAAWAKSQTIFRGIDLILSRSPLKFSIILNITNLPLIIKNYALAMPDSVSFKTFTLSSIIGAVFTSAPQIYLFQEAEDLDSIFDHKKNPLSTAFTIFSTVFSVAIILYFIWYTKKILSDIHKEVKTLKPADAELKDIQEEVEDNKDADKPQRQIEEEAVDKIRVEGIMLKGINPSDAASNRVISRV